MLVAVEIDAALNHVLAGQALKCLLFVTAAMLSVRRTARERHCAMAHWAFEQVARAKAARRLCSDRHNCPWLTGGSTTELSVTEVQSRFGNVER